MATLTIKQLASEIATLKGESLALECHPEESPFPSIEEKVRILTPKIIEEILNDVEVLDPEGTRQLGNQVTIDSEGVGVITLADDFFRLVYLKMSGWSRGIRRVTGHDEAESLYQASECKGIRGCPERPVVIMEVSPAGKKCLKLYSCTEGSRLETGWYFPRPVVTPQDSVEVPEEIKSELINRLTAAL